LKSPPAPIGHLRQRLAGEGCEAALERKPRTAVFDEKCRGVPDHRPLRAAPTASGVQGEGDNAENIVGGAEWSTLSHDAFPGMSFDFMMANPPYGKSWKKDLEAMGGKEGMRDPRFKVMHDGEEMSLVTRTSDGQMLFLANMVAKMQHDTPLGSRIAEVHNGSSLFTGDAGQGESNIRRWIIAKVAAKVEAFLSDWSDPSDTSDEDDDAPKKSLPEKKLRKLLDPKTWERDGRLYDTAIALREALGSELFPDHNEFREKVDSTLKAHGIKLGAADLKQILKAVSWRDENAPPVIAKIHKPGKAKPDPFHGLYETKIAGKTCVVEYETDSDLRDTEQVPLLEEGGIEAFIRREVLPYTPDAWVKKGATKIGYEVSFTRHFYKPQPLRTLEEIRADILAEEEAAEDLLGELLKPSNS